jgi:hypothetical protein
MRLQGNGQVPLDGWALAPARSATRRALTANQIAILLVAAALHVEARVTTDFCDGGQPMHHGSLLVLPKVTMHPITKASRLPPLLSRLLCAIDRRGALVAGLAGQPWRFPSFQRAMDLFAVSAR